MNKQKKIFKVLSTIFVVVLIGVIALTFLSLFGIPKNFRVFVVETGSMSPTMPTGSLAFVSPQSSYSKGDVITFNTPIEKDENKNYVVTHRINDVKTENGDVLFQTKGDANNTADNLWTNQVHVIGKVVGSIPLLGYVIGFAKTQIGFLVAVIIPALLIIYMEIQSIVKELKKRERQNINTTRRNNLDYL